MDKRFSQFPLAGTIKDSAITLFAQDGATVGATAAVISAYIIAHFATGGGFTALITAWWQTLPTTDPGISGAPWRNNGVLAFSP